LITLDTLFCRLRDRWDVAVKRDRPKAAPTVSGGVRSALAVLLVFVALVAPSQTDQLSPGALARIPADGLVVAILLLVVPARPRRVVAALLGAALGVFCALKIISLGFFLALARPFHLVTDRSLFVAPKACSRPRSVGGARSPPR
jgi:hypothetical protein